ncbi:MAG: hypothetical protein GY944_15505 [bacterium]|nr:hypothetical protein [bacterium]
MLFHSDIMIYHVLALLLAASVSTQVTGALQTATEFGVYAGGTVLGSQTVVSLPVNTAITQPRTVHVSTAGLGGPGSASATVGVTGSAAFSLTESGKSSTSIFAWPAAPGGTATTAPGAHDLLWTLRGSGTGTITAAVSTTHTQPWLATPPMLQVDVGDDGTWEIVVAAGTGGKFQLPVRVAGPLPVRVRAHASVAAGAQPRQNESYALRADFRFEHRATPARIVHYGQSCGPQLAVRDQAAGSAHSIAVDVTGAIPNALVALVFGNQRRSDPIAASGCLLYTRPVALLLLPSDPAGRAGWGIALPTPLRATLQLQGLAFDNGGRFAATDGVELTFVD